MTRLTEFLSKNPTMVVIVIWALILVMLSLVALVAYAVIQGREVRLWPPRIGSGPKKYREQASSRIAGSRLFQHKGYYPIDIAPDTNIPTVNRQILVRAIQHLLHDVHDRLAAMDIVYFCEDNRLNGQCVLDPEHHAIYEKLIETYELQAFRANHSCESERLFRNFRRIVEDLGETLRGVGFEIILHDVRNPLRSVRCAKNTDGISGRREGDPSTRFVVQYLRFQGEHLIGLENSNKVAYPKQFFKTKKVKATTTPLFDDQYGLIGILCFNIDVDSILALNADGGEAFIQAYCRTYGETPEFEKDTAPVDSTLGRSNLQR